MRYPSFSVFGLLAVMLCPLSASAACAQINPGQLDTDGDFAISRAEAQQSKLAPVFTQADANRDGVIVHGELDLACSLVVERDRQQANVVGDYVDEKVERQVDRQSHHVDNRVNREIDNAADSVIDRGLDSLFGH